MTPKGGTPRTDAQTVQVVECRHDGDHHFRAVRVDFARALERELDDLRAENEHIRMEAEMHRLNWKHAEAENARLRDVVEIARKYANSYLQDERDEPELCVDGQWERTKELFAALSARD